MFNHIWSKIGVTFSKLSFVCYNFQIDLKNLTSLLRHLLQFTKIVNPGLEDKKYISE